MPLSVGMDSVGEYMDIVTSMDIDPDAARERLNDVLVEGIEIIKLFVIEEDNTSLMSLVEAAEYQIIISKIGFDSLSAETIKHKLEQEELLTEKKGKKGIKIVDIKPLLLECSVDETEDSVQINLKALAGSSENLSPQLFLKTILDETDTQDKCMSITRKELYTRQDDDYKALDHYRRKV